uniref:Uncharacterized protein n=1 Tax=Anguilla anguilla TaxID=7936 RepID=A0A0E9TP74_ANGAN
MMQYMIYTPIYISYMPQDCMKCFRSKSKTS